MECMVKLNDFPYSLRNKTLERSNHFSSRGYEHHTKGLS